MSEENRRDAVADALRPVLEDGEAYKVFCHEGEVLVEEADTSVCAARHPRLYGRLLSLNARLEAAGGGLYRLPTLLALGFCVGVRLHWWDDWLGRELVEKLDSFWFFVLVFYVLFQALSVVTGGLQRGIYRQERDDLLALIAAESLDRDTLLAMIEGDEAVSRVGHHLKLDAAAAPPERIPGRE
jgi:hypothetical protein